MKNEYLGRILAGLCLPALIAGVMAAGGARPRKLIETGWDKPDERRLKQ